MILCSALGIIMGEPESAVESLILMDVVYLHTGDGGHGHAQSWGEEQGAKHCASWIYCCPQGSAHGPGGGRPPSWYPSRGSDTQAG